MKNIFRTNKFCYFISLIFSVLVSFSLHGEEKRSHYEFKLSGGHIILSRDNQVLFNGGVGFEMTGSFDENGQWTYRFSKPFTKINNGYGSIRMKSANKVEMTYKENGEEFVANLSYRWGQSGCTIEKINTQADVTLSAEELSLEIHNVTAHDFTYIRPSTEGQYANVRFCCGSVKVNSISAPVNHFIIGHNSIVETPSISARQISIEHTGILKLNGQAPRYNSITWNGRFENHGLILATGDLDLDTKGSKGATYSQEDSASCFEVKGKLTCRMEQGCFVLLSSKVLADSISIYARTIELSCPALVNAYVNRDHETNAFDSGRSSPPVLCASAGNMVLYAEYLINKTGLIISKQGMALTVSERIDNNAVYQWHGLNGQEDYHVEWIPASIISGDTMLITIKNEQCLVNKEGYGCAHMGLSNTGTLVANGVLQISTDNITKLINGLKNKRTPFINYRSLEKKIVVFHDSNHKTINPMKDDFEALREQRDKEISTGQPLLFNTDHNKPFVYTDIFKPWDGKSVDTQRGTYVQGVQEIGRNQGYEVPQSMYSQPHLRWAYSPDVEMQLVDQAIISAMGTRLPGFKDAKSQWDALRTLPSQQGSLRDAYYQQHKPFLIYTEEDCGSNERCYVPVLFMRGQEELLKTNQALIEGKQTIVNAPYSEVINFGTIRALENVSISAKTVKNISPGMESYRRVGSKVYEIRTQLPGGMIVGFDVDINVGNDPSDKGKTVFSNEGGTVFASHNINLYAKYGDQEIKPFLGSHVVGWNSGTLGELFGAKDSSLVVDYKAGRIAAGNDVKMIAEAGHILGEASELIAGNDANIQGAQGVLFRTLMSTYVDNEEVNLFKASHHENVSTGTMKVSSGHNVNIESSEGKTEGVGVAYDAADKLFFKGKKGNEQRAATAELNYWESSWGITPSGFFYETTKVKDEHIVQTKVSAREVIYETDFDNVFEAVIMCGKDAIHVAAGRDNKFVGHDSKTTVEQNGITLGISYPGSDLLTGLTGPGFLKYAENHEISKMLQRLKNGDPYDIAADSTTMLIDALRAALDYKDKVISSGMGNLPWLSNHLGFTDQNGSLSPSLQFRLGATHTTTESHEKTGSSINTVNFVCRGGGKTVFADGTQINVDYADIDASDVLFIGAENVKESTTHAGGVTVSYSASGTPGVGADYAHEHSNEKTHVQTTLNARKVKIQCKTLGIVDAYVSTEIIDGKVTEKFYVTQHPDTFKKTNVSASVNIGADSASAAASASHVDNSESKQQSGFHAATGTLETPLTEMNGATRINGTFTLDTETIIGHETTDHVHNDTNSFAFGLTPEARLAQGMADISHENNNKDTVNRPTVDPSVNLKTKKAEGINRDTSKMQEVLKDEHSYWRFAIPLVNPAKAKQTFEDLKNLFKKGKLSQKEYGEKIDEFDKAAGLDTFFNSDEEEPSSDDDESSTTNSDEQSSPEDQKDQSAGPSQEQQEQSQQQSGEQKSSGTEFEDFEVHDDGPEQASNTNKPAAEESKPSAEKKTGGEEEPGVKPVPVVNRAKIVAGSKKKNAVKIDLMEHNEFDEALERYGSWEAMMNDVGMNQDGTLTVAATKGFAKNFRAKGSIQELSDMAERLEAFVDMRPVLLAGPTTMDKIVQKCTKFLNFMDHVAPVKDTYTLFTNRDFDTDLKNRDWTGRMYAALNIALTVAEIKVAQVILTKLGVPIAKWLAKTKAGKAVINTVESALEKGAEKAKCAWNKATNFVGETFTPVTEFLEETYLSTTSKISGFALPKYNTMIKHWVDNKWFEKAVSFAKLEKIKDDLWKSPNGLLWGPCRKFGTRINHVLAHGFSNPFKDDHTMFNVPKEQIIKLVDDAWALRGNPLPNNPKIYDIPVNQIIGKNGETSIRIVVKAQTSEILTAFPIK